MQANVSDHLSSVLVLGIVVITCFSENPLLDVSLHVLCFLFTFAVPSSNLLFLYIAGNFCMVQDFTFLADRSAAAKIRTARIWIGDENSDVIALHVHVYSIMRTPYYGAARSQRPCLVTRKLKPQNFLLKGWQKIPWIFAPAKISRYTVFCTKSV